MARKSIALLLLILWIGNVQSTFVTTPDPEVDKLVKHDHLNVVDMLTSGYEHRQSAPAVSLLEFGSSRPAVSRALVQQQRGCFEYLTLPRSSNSKLYERNHVLRI